jgi:hypothetical protein
VAGQPGLTALTATPAAWRRDALVLH